MSGGFHNPSEHLRHFYQSAIQQQKEKPTQVNKMVYVSDKMQPGIVTRASMPPQQPLKKQLEPTVAPRRKMNEVQQKNLLDNYCKEVLKRVKNQGYDKSMQEGRASIPLGAQQRMAQAQKPDNQAIFIGNDEYSMLSSHLGLKSSGMISSALDTSPGGNVMQNMELLNNFFSASGKNNFYNSLNSFKSSPLQSPMHGISQNDITFAKDANSHLKVSDLNVLNRSWNLDDEEINEFNPPPISQDEGQHNKPKLQFIEKHKMEEPLRIKSTTSNIRASAVIMRSRSNQSGKVSQNTSQQRQSFHKTAISPIKTTTQYDQFRQTYEKGLKSSLNEKRRLSNNANVKATRVVTFNHNQAQELRQGKSSTSMSINQQIDESSMLKNYLTRKENNSNSRERQMNVIKNSLKKRLSSLEKDHNYQKIINLKALEALRSNTQLGFTSSMHGNPTSDLRHHIQERLSIERSKERQSIDFRDDQSVEMFNANKNQASHQTSVISDKGLRDSFNSKNDTHRSIKPESSAFRPKNSSTSSKRGRQSNQRNKPKAQAQPNSSILNASTSSIHNIKIANAYNSQHADYAATYSSVIKILPSTQTRNKNLNASNTASLQNSSQKQKPVQITGSVLFNAHSTAKVASGAPKIVQPNRTRLSEANLNSVRQQSNERNHSRNSSKSSHSGATPHVQRTSITKKPVVHEEYLQSTQFTHVRNKERSIFK